jgi:hypothetical protein
MEETSRPWNLMVSEASTEAAKETDATIYRRIFFMAV